MADCIRCGRGIIAGRVTCWACGGWVEPDPPGSEPDPSGAPGPQVTTAGLAVDSTLNIPETQPAASSAAEEGASSGGTEPTASINGSPAGPVH